MKNSRIQSLENMVLEKEIRCAFIHAPDTFYSDTQNYGAKFMPQVRYLAFT